MGSDYLMVMLTSLLTALPSLAIDLVMVIVAVVRWNKHPRVSMYAAAGGGLLLLLDLLGRAFFSILPLKLHESGRPPSEFGTIMGALSLVSGVLHAIAMGLVIAAVFVERRDNLPLPASAGRGPG